MIETSLPSFQDIPSQKTLFLLKEKKGLPYQETETLLLSSFSRSKIEEEKKKHILFLNWIKEIGPFITEKTQNTLLDDLFGSNQSSSVVQLLQNKFGLCPKTAQKAIHLHDSLELETIEYLILDVPFIED